MARTPREDSIYRISVHRNGGYLYAATHPFELDADGRRHYRYLHWGTVTPQGRFIPGRRYLTATPAERERLIFPEGWDLSEIGKGARTSWMQPFREQDRGKFYGDIWLLDSLAGELGIKDDLLSALGGDKARVQDLLTLAYYPYLTGHSYSRIGRWQRMTAVPSDREFDDEAINQVVKRISPKELEAFMVLRSLRRKDGSPVVVDSMSRSAYGESLSDQKWGQKKSRIHLRQTVEFVVYDSCGLPVCYRAVPGGVQDSNSLSLNLRALAELGFQDPILVSDRAYESISNMDRYILQGQKMVLCVNVQQPMVMEKILSLGEDVLKSGDLTRDSSSRRYSATYDLPYQALREDGSRVPVKGMKLNIFFNGARQEAEHRELDIEIQSQGEALRSILSSGARLDDDKALRRNYSWYNIVYDQATRTILSYSHNSARIESARRSAGFFANVTAGVEMSAMQAMSTYSLKYDQEKLLQQIRGLMDFEKRFSDPTEGRGGMLMVLFLNLVLGSYFRKIWASGPLKAEYRSPMDVLDRMQPLACRRSADGGRMPSRMDAGQKQICQAFGLATGSRQK